MKRRKATPAKPVVVAAFPIAGVGASAGGLEAFKKFFGAMPANVGVAFVLIQHLDPTRESLTAELVGTCTKMPVEQARNGSRVEANHVYVIPPNKYLSIRDGTLRLSAPAELRGLRMAVDYFLRSLAEDQHERAIGIILSGSGTDGALGVKELKAAGGMVMVQDPQTAQHDGMPRSAIASGSADYVLAPERMPDALRAYVQHAAATVTSMDVAAQSGADPMERAVALLREQTNFDFGVYKQGTLLRRIQRRMSLKHCSGMSAYVDLLCDDPVEVAALFQDFLINVTSFFREPAAWKVLREQVIRRLVAERHGDAMLRVWVPACSTGEEAYSLAMVLLEEVHAAGKRCRVQVFASDVDAQALETARGGTYPEGITAHVQPEQLSRFFTPHDHHYQVNKELRAAVVFARQNVICDPPFSRLDLISCRNLLIYLEPDVQKRIIAVLHFALVEGGYAFLGSSETIGPHAELFEPISNKWRIYRHLAPARRGKLPLPVAIAHVEPAGRTHAPNQAHLAMLANRALLRRYAPACVIIDRTGQILYFHGRIGDYLTQPTGLPMGNLIAPARGRIRGTLRDAVRDAIHGEPRVVTARGEVRRGGSFARVNVTIEPLDVTAAETERLWLVSFEDEREPVTLLAADMPPSVAASGADPARVRQLESALKNTDEDLQQTVDDLRIANEELMSVNEELQSTNEELETSTEELQSLNEELTTANAQLENKIGELEATNNDLDNLLASTKIATVFLDTGFCIRRFTPAATVLFSLIPSDVGRPLSDIAQKFVDPTLLFDAKEVLQRPVSPKTEVQAHDGRRYVRQVLPYRTRDNRTEGVVITFSDVAAEALEEARLYAESIVDTVREPLLVLDGSLRVRSANQSFRTMFERSQQDTVGRYLYDLGDYEWNIPRLRTLLRDVLAKKQVLNDFEMEYDFEAVGRRSLLLNARALSRGGDRPDLILVAIEDVTERKHVQQVLRENETRKHLEEQVRERQVELAHALRISTVGELASGLAHELNQPLSAIANGVEACARYVRSAQMQPKRLLALLEDTSTEALRAGEIVAHLRSFIERGEPRLERTDLCEVVRAVPRLLRHEIERAHILLRTRVPSDPLMIRADRIQIEQVIVNLMQNAIDVVSEPGEGRKEIELTLQSMKGVATVAVRDTGTGVSKEVAERLFDAFFTTKTEGLGMGLAISRSIIEAHRGRIGMKPRADGVRGSTAFFTLPIQRSTSARKRRAS